MYQQRQFLRLCRHTRIMGWQHQQRGTVGENQHWQKEIVLHWKDCFQNSQNYCSTGDSRTEYSSWRPCFHRNCPTLASQIQHSRKGRNCSPSDYWSNAEMRKLRSHDHETWTSDNWYGQMSRPWYCFLHQDMFALWEHPRKPKLRNPWFQQSNMGPVLWCFGE
jgi:hypothetical protein